MLTRSLIVQKYGGSSVASPAKILQVAELIAKRYREGTQLCIVVSAMGKTTDQLLAQATQLSPSPSRRELDMLLTCGERASMALLAIALEKLDIPSISLTGSQSGIITTNTHSNAQILEIKPFRVCDELNQNKVVIIAGYQGISLTKEITTLGRGGSDTTAIAMAAALNAAACEIYSDVDGVYSADPKLVSNAFLLENLGLEEMLALSYAGAKVLNHQAIWLAKQLGITIHARKTGDNTQRESVLRPACSSPSGPLSIAHKDNIYGVLLKDQEQLEQFLIFLQAISIVPQEIIYHATLFNAILCFIYPEDAHGLTQNANYEVLSLSSVSVVGSSLSSPHFFAPILKLLKAKSLPILGFHLSPTQLKIWIASHQTSSLVNYLHDHLFPPP